MRKVQVRYLINLERLRLGDLKGKRPEGAGLFPTVHDELIVELSLKDTGTVKKLLEGVMLAKKSVVSLYSAVIFDVEAHICEDWSEK